jgi:hypothetical protein
MIEWKVVEQRTPVFRSRHTPYGPVIEFSHFDVRLKSEGVLWLHDCGPWSLRQQQRRRLAWIVDKIITRLLPEVTQPSYSDYHFSYSSNKNNV